MSKCDTYPNSLLVSLVCLPNATVHNISVMYAMALKSGYKDKTVGNAHHGQIGFFYVPYTSDVGPFLLSFRGQPPIFSFKINFKCASSLP